MVADIVGSEKLDVLRKEKESHAIEAIKIRLQDFCEATIQEVPDCPLVVEKVIVETGHPVDQIILYSEEIDADLIIMGSRGQGMLADVTMGSTSRRVLRRCSRPVLVVRLPEDGN